MSSTKRVYLYLVTIVSLGILAAGARQLLSLALDLVTGSSSARVRGGGFDQQQLSLGLAMLVIGAPLWYFFWRTIQRRVSESGAEVGSPVRKLFLNGILAVAGLSALFAANALLMWLLAGAALSRFQSGSLATLIVAAAGWFYHWRLSEREGHPSPQARTLRRWYLYLLSGWGLVWLGAGLVQLIDFAVLGLPIWGTTVSGAFWNDAVRHSLTWVVLGGTVWAFHWSRTRGDSDSSLRQVYLYLLTILGSSVAGLVAVTVTVVQLFVWLFGGVTGSAALHFRFLGWVVPTVLVSAAAWSYHQRVAIEEAAQVHQRRLSAQRVHSYLMSFVGLGALAAGLIAAFGVLLDLVIDAAAGELAVRAPGWWQQQLSLCLALLLVATPLWLYYWGRVLRRTAAGGITEWRARSRRIYLYGFVAAALITIIADLVNIVFQFLSGLLQGGLGTGFLSNIRWSLQSLLVAAPVLAYHWQVVSQDRSRGAEAVAERKAVTILVGEMGMDLVTRIEERLDTRLQVLRRLGEAPEDVPALSDEDIDRLAEEVQSAPGTRVMLVAAGGRLLVVPYEER